MKSRLKQYREEAGLSQEDLSKKSGVSRNTISLIETQNTSNVTYDTMSKLAKPLNKKVAEIFFEE